MIKKLKSSKAAKIINKLCDVDAEYSDRPMNETMIGGVISKLNN